MHQSMSIFLVDDNVRCVGVSYKEGEKVYPFKTMDDDIDVDDLVVVPTSTRYGFTVCKVVEVDIDPDFDKDVEMKWIVNRLDTSDFDQVTKQERVLIRTAKAAEKKRKKEQLRKDFLNLNEEELKEIGFVPGQSSETRQLTDT